MLKIVITLKIGREKLDFKVRYKVNATYAEENMYISKHSILYASFRREMKLRKSSDTAQENLKSHN